MRGLGGPWRRERAWVGLRSSPNWKSEAGGRPQHTEDGELDAIEDVRLAPKSGARADIAGGLSRAQFPTQAVAALRAHEFAHSITSSARNSTAVGSSRPIALAVFRLTKNSNRVGCSTGRSVV